VPCQPILTHRGSITPSEHGHAELVQAPDDSWWMVLLGVRRRRHPGLARDRREIFLAPVHWMDGWPVVGDLSLDLRARWPLRPVRSCRGGTTST